MNIIGLQDKNLYYVGGIVRDELLGKENFDVDLVYVGNAIEFAKTIIDAEILQINEPFGTVKIEYRGQKIDIASTREEIYPKKGHLPEVCNIGCSLKSDVLRRDFTINAMAKSTYNEEIVDYTNGLEDIKRKKIRVLHEKSFVDDPTRIIRALKFRVRFGFEMEEQTKILQQEYLKNINYDMSYKRLKKELEETFNLNSNKAFELFINENIYKLVSDKEFVFQNFDIENLVKTYVKSNIWLIYVGILPDISKIPLTKLEQKIVDDYKLLKGKKFKNDIEIYENFKGLNPESLIMYAITEDEKSVKRYFDYLSKIRLEISGNDLKKLGLNPSKKYQECFKAILREKFKNPSMKKIEELEIAQKIIENN